MEYMGLGGERALRFGWDGDDPFIHYALDLISRFLGVTTERSSVTEADVYYGVLPESRSALLIPRQEGYTAGEASRLLETATDEQAVDRAVFPYDVFSALRFFLADEGNANLKEEAFDQYDRLRGAYYCGGDDSLRRGAPVNVCLQSLRSRLERRLGVKFRSYLPKGKKCVVAISHDVDNPINYGDPTHKLETAIKGISRGRWGLGMAQAASAGLECLRWVKRPGMKMWLFDEIMKMESEYGFRSSFYFAAASRFDRGTNPLDVGYDIEAPRFRRLFKKLRGNGFEIGLHASYNAMGGVERMGAERRRLAELSGAEAAGNRHHYWRMGKPFWRTLDLHQQAGFTYDSSIGFNDRDGFRLGAALPIRLWNPETGRRIECISLPVMLMDGAYFASEQKTVEAALDSFCELLNKLKNVEGAAAIDWHEYTSYPGSMMSQEMGRAYQMILKRLAEDSETAVMTCAEAAKLLEPVNED